MSRLADIPVRVEPWDPPEPAARIEPPREGLCGGVAAVLSELATLLERLFDDLRSQAT